MFSPPFSCCLLSFCSHVSTWPQGEPGCIPLGASSIVLLCAHALQFGGLLAVWFLPGNPLHCVPVCCSAPAGRNTWCNSGAWIILYLSFCFWCGSQFCLLSLQVWFPATVSWCCANRHFLPICLGLMDVTHCRRHPLLATGARAQCRLGHQISSFLSGGQFRLSAAKPLHHLPCEGLRSMPRPRPLCWASSCFVWLQGCQTMILGPPVPLFAAVLPLDRQGGPPLPSPPGGSPLAERPCPRPEAQKHLFCWVPIVWWAGREKGSEAPSHYGMGSTRPPGTPLP